jgi:hypothetical protein
VPRFRAAPRRGRACPGTVLVSPRLLGCLRRSSGGIAYLRQQTGEPVQPPEPVYYRINTLEHYAVAERLLETMVFGEPVPFRPNSKAAFR